MPQLLQQLTALDFAGMLYKLVFPNKDFLALPKSVQTAYIRDGQKLRSMMWGAVGLQAPEDGCPKLDRRMYMMPFPGAERRRNWTGSSQRDHPPEPAPDPGYAFGVRGQR